MGCVYLLHITPPLGHARHYVGYTDDVEPSRRLAKHAKGQGSKMLRAAVSSGRVLSVVHHWPGATRRFEAYLKRRADTPSWCPACVDLPAKRRRRSVPGPAQVPNEFVTETKRARRTRLRAITVALEAAQRELARTARAS